MAYYPPPNARPLAGAQRPHATRPAPGGVSELQAEVARLQQALEGYRAAVLTAAREIDDAAVQLVKTAERQGDLDASLDAAERSLALATRRYQEGYSGFQRVLDAQRALAAQADRAISNQGDHLQAVIQLYAALGGGWEPAR